MTSLDCGTRKNAGDNNSVVITMVTTSRRSRGLQCRHINQRTMRDRILADIIHAVDAVPTYITTNTSLFVVSVNVTALAPINNNNKWRSTVRRQQPTTRDDSLLRVVAKCHSRRLHLSKEPSKLSQWLYVMHLHVWVTNYYCCDNIFHYCHYYSPPYLKHAGTTPGQYYRQRSTPGQPL